MKTPNSLINQSLNTVYIFCISPFVLIFQKIIDTISMIMRLYFNTLENGFKYVFDLLKMFMIEILKTWMNLFSNIFNNLINYLEKLTNQYYNLIINFANQFFLMNKSIIMYFFTMIQNFEKSISQKIFDVFNNTISSFFFFLYIISSINFRYNPAI